MTPAGIDLDGASTTRTIWRLGWPVMISTALAAAMTLVDLFWIGRLGSREVAAVALSGSVRWVYLALVHIVSGGTAALVGRYAGAGDDKRLCAAAEASIVSILLIAVPVTAAGLVFTPQLLGLFGAEAAVVQLGVPYLRALFAGTAFTFLTLVVFTIMNARGDTRTPMWISAVGNLVNILLDPLLIFGLLGLPRLGVLGAGIATVAAQGLSLVVALVMLRRSLPLCLWPGRGHARVMVKLWRIGLPASLHAMTRPLTGMLMFSIVATFDTAVIAAFSIGMQSMWLMYIYIEGLGTATRTLVAQHLGAGHPDRAAAVVRETVRMGLGLQFCVSALFVALAPRIIALFRDQEAVIAAGTSYLWIIAPCVLFHVLAVAFSNAQRGAGVTAEPMVASIIANGVFKVPAAYLAVTLLEAGPVAVWLSIGASLAVEAAVVALFFRRGNWRRKVV